MHTLISSVVGPWRKAQTTNSTATSFSAALATTTRPAKSATRSVIALPGQGTRESNTLVVMPYGGDSNDDVLNQKVIGWNFLKDAGTYGLWIPQLVCEIQGTMSSTLLGVALEDVVATEFFCDAITLTTGIAVLKNGTANVDSACYIVDASGFELLEIQYDLGAGGDQQNALYRLT